MSQYTCYSKHKAQSRPLALQAIVDDRLASRYQNTQQQVQNRIQSEFQQAHKSVLNESIQRCLKILQLLKNAQSFTSLVIRKCLQNQVNNSKKYLQLPVDEFALIQLVNQCKNLCFIIQMPRLQNSYCVYSRKTTKLLQCLSQQTVVKIILQPEQIIELCDNQIWKNSQSFFQYLMQGIFLKGNNEQKFLPFKSFDLFKLPQYVRLQFKVGFGDTILKGYKQIFNSQIFACIKQTYKQIKIAQLGLLDDYIIHSCLNTKGLKYGKYFIQNRFQKLGRLLQFNSQFDSSLLKAMKTLSQRVSNAKNVTFCNSYLYKRLIKEQENVISKKLYENLCYQQKNKARKQALVLANLNTKQYVILHQKERLLEIGSQTSVGMIKKAGKLKPQQSECNLRMKVAEQSLQQKVTQLSRVGFECLFCDQTKL